MEDLSICISHLSFNGVTTYMHYIVFVLFIFCYLRHNLFPAFYWLRHIDDGKNIVLLAVMPIENVMLRIF